MKKVKKTESLIDWLDKHSGAIIAIFTIILVCATVYYVILTNRILLESKKQAEITNRPYVGLGSFDVSMVPNKFSFDLLLVNVGRCPAAEVMIEYDWLPVYQGWKFSQEVDGKNVEIERKKIQHLFFGEPTTIFPNVILVRTFVIEYNHTLDYWVKKYKEISIIITIYYRGIEPKGLHDFYKSKFKLVYKPHKDRWDVDRSEVY